MSLFKRIEVPNYSDLIKPEVKPQRKTAFVAKTKYSRQPIKPRAKDKLVYSYTIPSIVKRLRDII